MRICIHGNDHGNAVLLSLLLILALSMIFLTIVPHITAIKRYSHLYKTQVLDDINKTNGEIKRKYDFY